MDIETARFVLMTTVRSREDLASIVSVIKENCSDEDYSIISRKVATVVYDISSDIVEYLFEKFPELKREYEANTARFGRAFY